MINVHSGATALIQHVVDDRTDLRRRSPRAHDEKAGDVGDLAQVHDKHIHRLLFHGESSDLFRGRLGGTRAACCLGRQGYFGNLAGPGCWRASLRHVSSVTRRRRTTASDTNELPIYRTQSGTAISTWETGSGGVKIAAAIKISTIA